MSLKTRRDKLRTTRNLSWATLLILQEQKEEEKTAKAQMSPIIQVDMEVDFPLILEAHKLRARLAEKKIYKKVN